MNKDIATTEKAMPLYIKLGKRHPTIVVLKYRNGPELLKL